MLSLGGAKMKSWTADDVIKSALEDKSLELMSLAELRSCEIPSFLSQFLSTRQKLSLIDQALRIISDHYCHLPHKKAATGNDPILRLRSLRMKVLLADEQSSAAHSPVQTARNEVRFHKSMIETFRGMKDRHFRYRLPSPFPRYIAFLPFLVARYYDSGELRIMVNRLLPDYAHSSFTAGSIITHWNGVPIDRYVEHLGDRLEGSNDPSEDAMGVARLTTRPLGWFPFPEEDWVTVSYIQPGQGTQSERPKQISLEWGIAKQTQEHAAEAPTSGAPCPHPDTVSNQQVLCVDDETEKVHLSRRSIFLSRDQLGEQIGRQDSCPASPYDYAPRPQAPYDYVPPPADSILSDQPTSLGPARRHPALSGSRIIKDSNDNEYFYLRIRSFNPSLVPSESTHLSKSDQAQRGRSDLHLFLSTLVNEIPADMWSGSPKGLIIDVRGNTGGSIVLALATLQYILPALPDTLRFQYLATPENIWLARELELELNSPSSDGDRCCPDPTIPETYDWRTVRDALRTGDSYSAPIKQPVLRMARLVHHKQGQRYSGPVTVVTDSLAYSATDMFVSAFNDMDRGTIISTDKNIGAGGASVKTSEDLIRLSTRCTHPSDRFDHDIETPFDESPGGAGFLFSAQRITRITADGSIVPIEGFGLKDGQDRIKHCALTKEDVLPNAGSSEPPPLIKAAFSELDEAFAGTGRIRLQIAVRTPPGEPEPEIDIKAQGLSRVTIESAGFEQSAIAFDQRAPRAEIKRIVLKAKVDSDPSNVETPGTELDFNRIVLCGFRSDLRHPDQPLKLITRKVYTNDKGPFISLAEKNGDLIWK